jgi:hypothetical protein
MQQGKDLGGTRSKGKAGRARRALLGFESSGKESGPCYSMMDEMFFPGVVRS